ncbi:acyltransferase family protein [Kitasatospora sp. LaBMicrA B282]|uniref:acyltransferase family protein n=1 Tax=Kitasatospora sp. LaBMicrA B282 TaxID=3420949 RepID=UPI003D0A1AC4
MPRKLRKKPSPLAGEPLATALKRENGFGLLRLLLALSVIFAHAEPLGFAKLDLGLAQTRGQSSLGGIAVGGFFVLSGLLITRSGMRLSPARFAWNRAIRILPGYWACLAVTVFVLAPLVAYHQGRLDGFWSHPQGPWDYVKANWGLGIDQWGISGLLDHTPYKTAFNGSVWSLAYEVFCYLAVGAFAALGILRRARWVVAASVAGLYAILMSTVLTYPHLQAPLYASNGLGGWRFPLLGSLDLSTLVPLVLMFGLGALAELYRERLPMNGVAAVLALGLFLGSAHYGGLQVIGMPAFAYLLIWLAARMPRPLTRIGTKVDLSYGIYIYAFPAQQCLSLFHLNRWGYAPYTALSIAVSAAAALLSWYLVEKPALRLKDLGTSKPGTPLAQPVPPPRVGVGG